MLTVVSYLSIALLLLYTVWQLVNLWGWLKTVARPANTLGSSLTRAEALAWDTKSYGLHENPPPPTIALLVPFRNEADNLPRLAASLLAQDYPGQLELIFIDDHSSDGGAELLPPEVSLLKLEDHLNGQEIVAHKKAALTYAISTTDAEVIITTDADCFWPAGRVSCVAAAFEDGADIVLGPVLINPTDGFCNAFQTLDLAAYQFLTAATAHQGRPALANGANFAFRRALFNAVGGYQGVDHLPSGDDVLLLHKFYQPQSDASKSSTIHVPLLTHYAPSASISTAPVAGWQPLWSQRLRWAGKAGNYNNPKLSFAQALAFALSVAIVLSVLSFPLHLRPRLIVLLWGGKALIDLICLWSVMKHFKQANTMKWYPAAAVVYPFFLVGVGTAALLGFTTKWKGRQ